jgi:hypothetical protein
MKTTNIGILALVGIISFAGQASAQSSQPEEIYVVRSVRDSRVRPTEFCGREKTGSSPVAEDHAVTDTDAAHPL